jgi:uncharacterized protein TIGR03905
LKYEYITQGTCSRQIRFDIDGDVIRNVEFAGGCDGNLQAIPRLVEGFTVTEIEEKVKGILCGRRPTSCADQLAVAVRQAYDAQRGAAE